MLIDMLKLYWLFITQERIFSH